MRSLHIVLILSLFSVAATAADWNGDLVIIQPEGWRSGQTVTLQLECRVKNGTNVEAFANRKAMLQLSPQRFNLFAAEPLTLTADGSGNGSFRFKLPADLKADYYHAAVMVSEDDGDMSNMANALQDAKSRRRFATRIIPIRSNESGPFFRLHTERARSVFSPGEQIRIFVSARGRQAIDDEITVALIPQFGNSKAMPVAKIPVSASAGQENTAAVDILAESSAAIAPGDYTLAAVRSGKVVDRYPVRFVAAERPSGGARWGHTMPHGTNGGITSRQAVDTILQNNWRYNGHFNQMKNTHNANLWVHFFANAHPVIAANPIIPEADAADLPPSAAQYRPALHHAMYQQVMARGMALGITTGYGEDYKAETYMPVPTEIPEDIQTMARKYLSAGLGAAQYPNFVALYTDYYGHFDFMGAGEIDGEHLSRIRNSAWDNAFKNSMQTPEKPYSFQFNPDKFSDEFMKLTGDKKTSKANRKKWKGALTAKGLARFRDLGKWLDANYPSQDERLALWNELWGVMGVRPAPEPRRTIPVPVFKDQYAKKVGKETSYQFADYMLRGFQRAYGAFTKSVETELPAVFTIHNKGTMNHSYTSHAWSGYRSPNIDPAYLSDGASAISVSEWNLDGVPKPYFLTTFYNRTLVDDGHPVYRAGLWKQAGSPTRWMRDTVFWMGRQIHTYFDQAGNMTWSHLGSDQTTYASNERMAQVTEFHSYYSDLANKLEPIREIGMYIPAYGTPWGNAITRGHYIGMVAGLMSDHQIHMVSHGDIAKDRLKNYPVLYAPSTKGPDLFPHEVKGIQSYIQQGGKLAVTPLPDYYHPEETLTQYGVQSEERPEIGKDGQPRKNKDGSIRMKRHLIAPFSTWEKITKEWNWKGFSNVHVADIWTNKTFTHLDENGKPATWSGSHWTGHHVWAPVRGGSLYQYKELAKVFDQIHEPIIRKDKAEVFVNVTKPKDPKADGLFIFASNWTLPETAELFSLRVPQGFFKSMVQPVSTELRLKADVGAIYDVINAEEVPFRKEGDRVVFTAHLDSVEGRIFAAYPEKVASAALIIPDSVESGSDLSARFELRGASGQALSVLGSVRLRLKADDGTILYELKRALPASGDLPTIPVPSTVGTASTLEVVDTITGQVATTQLNIVRKGFRTARVEPVTEYRGDRMHQWFQAHKNVNIVIDSGSFSVDRRKNSAEFRGDHPNLRAVTSWANQLKSKLAQQGITAMVVDSKTAIDGAQSAHPWTGKMAGYRQRGTVPHVRIRGQAILVGDPSAPGIMREIHSGGISQRSLGKEHVGQGRAVIAWAPKLLSAQDDSIILAASDQAGADAAINRLVAIVKQAPAADSYYTARESIRQAWAPTEVDAWKQHKGLTDAPAPLNSVAGTEIPATPGWNELTTLTGTAIVNIAANENGIAVGTKSWVKPTGLLGTDGSVKGFWGGAEEVTPRDVGLSSDGQTVYAGYSLLGYATAYNLAQGKLFSKPSAIAYSTNPFGWDSFKDSDRNLKVSPDHKTLIVAAGAQGIIATDTDTNKELWRIETSFGNRPRGALHPEIAFSPDGRYALVTPYRSTKASIDVSVPVLVNEWDAKKNRYGKKKTLKYFQTKARLNVKSLTLVEARTGKIVWEHATEADLYDISTGNFIWRNGKEPEWTVEQDPNDGKRKKWKGNTNTPPVLANKQPLPIPELRPMSFWHLYSTVGPDAQWTITATRDAHFSLHDKSGKVARTFISEHLPRELDPGKMISPVFQSSNDPHTLFAFAPQSRKLFLLGLKIGSEAQRQQARDAEQKTKDTMALVKKYASDRNLYRSYEKPEVIKKMRADLAHVPKSALDEFVRRAERAPKDIRAKRKVSERSFNGQIAGIREALLKQLKPASDLAASLNVKQSIQTPDMIHDAITDASLSRVYVGLWDHTVRCYDLRSGEEIWSTQVIGGSKLALTGDSLYAGGTRGDVFRLNAADGSISWRTNITAATNKLD